MNVKKLRIWDESNTNKCNEIYNEIVSYGARYIKAVDAYHNNVPCGYTLVFDPSNIKPEDRTYLSLTRGYNFG